MVVFDATTLLVLLAPNAAVPKDEQGHVIAFARERIDGFVRELEESRTKIIVPTPALSEVLVRAGPIAGAAYLQQISKAAAFRIEAFDERAALEVAAMTHAAIEHGDKRAGGDGPWAKIKYDRQIVAIAKVNRASAIYSDDGNVQSFGRKLGMNVLSVADLPIPVSAAQMSLLTELETPHGGEESAKPTG